MEEVMVNLITGYIALMSLLGFLLMGIDKQRAKKRAWRIPEKTLVFTAFLGGGIGSLIGMYLFRHKTKHAKFIILFPIAAILILALLYVLYA